MKKISGKKIFLTCLLLFLPVVTFNVNIHSQYIEDDAPDDTDREDVKKEVDKEKKRDGTLPPYIAYNIRAVRVPFMSDSIRISWNINPNYDDEFIIGRSGEIIDTRDRALAAQSVSVVNSRSKNLFIDENLKPGIYYYVVIARDKIQGREVELYRDINYTGFPVTIEAPAEASGQVNGISARTAGENRIVVTWTRLKKQGVAYYVYRSGSALDSRDSLRGARKAGTVIDGDEFTDHVTDGEGPWFYAVALKDSDGAEKFEPVQDQNYTTRGIRFDKKTTLGVSGIQASLTGPREVTVKWSAGGGESGDEPSGFVIYRSREIIDSGGKLSGAQQAGSVPRNTMIFADTVPGPGEWFYAVCPRSRDGVIQAALNKNESYTPVPVSVSDGFEILSISSRASGKGVEVTWSYSGVPGDAGYRIYRTRTVPAGPSKIRKGDVIGSVNIRDRKFIDESPRKGGYYYGLVPASDREGFSIRKGVTITRSPVSLKPEMRERDEGETENPAEIEEIIGRTFFKGYYRDAIKELKIIAEKADNERESAKAFLFIGRSWIELGEYDKALLVLMKKEVRRAFPREAVFWTEFAAVRLKK